MHVVIIHTADIQTNGNVAFQEPRAKQQQHQHHNRHILCYHIRFRTCTPSFRTTTRRRTSIVPRIISSSRARRMHSQFPRVYCSRERAYRSRQHRRNDFVLGKSEDRLVCNREQVQGRGERVVSRGKRVRSAVRVPESRTRIAQMQENRPRRM